MDDFHQIYFAQLEKEAFGWLRLQCALAITPHLPRGYLEGSILNIESFA
jgi:hypothetical protein